jgi:hypothetical protein
MFGFLQSYQTLRQVLVGKTGFSNAAEKSMRFERQ